jgi:lysyl-tRNA synthetase class 2
MNYARRSAREVRKNWEFEKLMTNNRNTPDDFRPTAPWANLRLRATMLRRVRMFFDQHGFLEVETPVLSRDIVVDRHLDPFCVEGGQGSGFRGQGSGPHLSSSGPHPNPLRAPTEGWSGEGTAAQRMWLQTSPEFAMKRLLAAGGEAIYQVARVFRRDELGPLHNPEFTLVEWYRAGDDMERGMQLTSDLCDALLSSRHTPCAVCPEIEVDGTANGTRRVPATYSAERMSYREAFQRYVGLDPHTADNEELAAATRAAGIEPPASLPREDRDGWLDLLMVERIQPHLGIEQPVLLYDYPASQAALARVRPGDPPVAERFELYVAGLELANGYHELLDPAELRARNARINAQRQAEGKTALPEQSRLLQAMEAGLPPAVGVALGFDRLVMLAAGAKTIAEVIAFPFDRA